MMNLVMNGEYYYILRLRFIEPVPKMFYILLDKDPHDNVFDVNIDIQKALREKNIVALSSVLQKNIDEFNEWYSVAYYEAVLRMCKEPLDFLRYMVLRSLEGRAKLGLGISEIIRIYHSTEGIVDAYLKSIQNQLDKAEEKTMSDKVSPATSMSTESKYYILRVNHWQKVCYVILGDIPGFKALKTMGEIRSYFEKNNIDISVFLFHVSFDMYQRWLQLMVSEDLIDINAGKDPVFDVMKLKRHATSIKYELEIEPNATIRSYTCNIPEIAENLFNEWFNDASQSDKRKEKEMSDKVSPALSKIEERIKQLNQLERDSNDVVLDIQKHKNAIEELTFKLDELDEDIRHVRDRIGDLCSQAMIREGFTEEYIRRFLKERGFKKQ